MQQQCPQAYFCTSQSFIPCITMQTSLQLHTGCPIIFMCMAMANLAVHCRALHVPHFTISKCNEEKDEREQRQALHCLVSHWLFLALLCNTFVYSCAETQSSYCSGKPMAIKPHEHLFTHSQGQQIHKHRLAYEPQCIHLFCTLMERATQLHQRSSLVSDRLAVSFAFQTQQKCFGSYICHDDVQRVILATYLPLLDFARKMRCKQYPTT